MYITYMSFSFKRYIALSSLIKHGHCFLKVAQLLGKFTFGKNSLRVSDKEIFHSVG